MIASVVGCVCFTALWPLLLICLNLYMRKRVWLDFSFLLSLFDCLYCILQVGRSTDAIQIVPGSLQTTVYCASAFMFATVKDEAWFWPVLLTVFKLLFAVAIAFLQTASVEQICALCVLLVTLCILQNSLAPYWNRTDNLLASLAYGVLILTLMLAESGILINRSDLTMSKMLARILGVMYKVLCIAILFFALLSSDYVLPWLKKCVKRIPTSSTSSSPTPSSPVSHSASLEFSSTASASINDSSSDSRYIACPS